MLATDRPLILSTLLLSLCHSTAPDLRLWGVTRSKGSFTPVTRPPGRARCAVGPTRAFGQPARLRADGQRRRFDVAPAGGRRRGRAGVGPARPGHAPAATAARSVGGRARYMRTPPRRGARVLKEDQASVSDGAVAVAGPAHSVGPVDDASERAHRSV